MIQNCIDVYRSFVVRIEYFVIATKIIHISHFLQSKIMFGAIEFPQFSKNIYRLREIEITNRFEKIVTIIVHDVATSPRNQFLIIGFIQIDVEFLLGEDTPSLIAPRNILALPQWIILLLKKFLFCNGNQISQCQLQNVNNNLYC